MVLRRYARLSEFDRVVEFIELPEEIKIEDALHPDLASRTVDVTDDSAVETGWMRVGESLVPDLVGERSAKKLEMRTSYEKYLSDNFKSSALGSENFYSTSAYDLIRLQWCAIRVLSGSASSRETVSLNVKLADGTYSLRAHDARQLREVCDDYQRLLSDASARLTLADSRTDEAKTKEEIRSVRW